jgi:hypothetical protein
MLFAGLRRWGARKKWARVVVDTWVGLLYLSGGIEPERRARAVLSGLG